MPVLMILNVMLSLRITALFCVGMCFVSTKTSLFSALTLLLHLLSISWILTLVLIVLTGVWVSIS